MTDSVESTAPFDAEAHPRRLNLGCGFDLRAGYLNVDFQEFHEPDLVGDARHLSMLPSGFYEEIVAQDVLEHLERQDVDPALREWARLLQPGGHLVLRVPDIIGTARVLAGTDSLDLQRTLVQNLFGTQAYTGDYHHCGFTELTLRASLHDAGFRVVTMTRRDEWMFDCVAERVADPGNFDPGPLPFLSICDHAETAEPTPLDNTGRSPGVGGIDRIATSVGGRLPESVRRRARAAWHPVRRLLERRGAV